MSPPERGGRPPAEGRPETNPTPASQEQTIAAGRDTGQADLFAYAAELASRARDTGLAIAERNDAEWSERVMAWIEDIDAHEVLTADDVRARFGPSMAMGSVFRRASQAGLIVSVGFTESNSITRHRGLQRVWRRT